MATLKITARLRAHSRHGVQEARQRVGAGGRNGGSPADGSSGGHGPPNAGYGAGRRLRHPTVKADNGGANPLQAW